MTKLSSTMTATSPMVEASFPMSPAGSNSGERASLFDGRAEGLLAEMRRLPEGDVRRERLCEELVRMHVPFVRNVARRYRNRGESAEDLEQAAMVGLMKAINAFDPAVSPRFLAYASVTVYGEVKRHFRDRLWAVRVPRSVQELRPRVRRVREDFCVDQQRSPTVAELAAALEVDEEEIVEALAADSAYHPSSLDVPIGEDGDALSLGETIGDPDRALENVADKQTLRLLMAELPERELRVLQLRFWGNLTQAQIAEKIGVSQMHVSRLLSRTLTQMRKQMLAPADA